MNIVQKINRSYNASRALLSLYQNVAFDKDAEQILNLAKLYADKAKGFKKDLDEVEPDFNDEVMDLVDEIKTEEKE